MSAAPLLSLPDSACIASVIMTFVSVSAISESPFTLEEQGFSWPGERRVMDLRMPPITKRDDASQWIAFGEKLKGTYGRFLMGPPGARYPQGQASGTPLVNGGSQTGNSLNTKGWTPGVTGILKQGDYIQLGTGTSSRLYMLTADATSDGSGNSVLSISPALRTSPNNEDSVIVSDPKGCFRMDGNEFSYSIDPGPVYRFGFRAIEVVNA